MSKTIALDSMGGDYGPQIIVPAAISAIKNHSDLSLILVGDQTQIESELNSAPQNISDKIEVHHTTQVVGMSEPPAQALRSKKDSSMRVAINMVKGATRPGLCKCRQYRRVNGNSKICFAYLSRH